MLPTTAPASLLVPIALEAWVVTSQTQQVLSGLKIDYEKLEKLESPLSRPFEIDTARTRGVHLHWALPDALTRSRERAPGEGFNFPLVPNRWLVVRCKADYSPDKATSDWKLKAWVVQSDYLHHQADVPPPGSSPYLNPAEPLAVYTDTKAQVNAVPIGKSYPIEAWETERKDDKYFLRAVSPGNISFAAYQPFSKNVFSFVDEDAARDEQPCQYTYLVVGWYASVDPADPLAGVTTYVAESYWPSKKEWDAQTEVQRLKTIMAGLGWHLNPPLPPDATGPMPATSLYHGLVVDVQWPYHKSASPALGDARVVVGNTASEALATLVQAYARQEALAAASAGNDPAQAAWLTAGDTLTTLLQAATLEVLDKYGQPGGAAQAQQQLEQSWFGTAPGGTLWQVVPATPSSAGFQPLAPPTPAQQARIGEALARLNTSQQAYDEAQRTLEAQQGSLYRLWLKRTKGLSATKAAPIVSVPKFKDVLQPVLTSKLYPELAQEVQQRQQAQQQARAALPQPTTLDNANDWADAHWDLATPAGGPATLTGLGLELKVSTAANFWHPADPVLLIATARRAHKHGEDGRYAPDGTLACRLASHTVTGLLDAAGQPTITTQDVAGKLGFDQFSTFLRVPALIEAVPRLLAEAFFSDPANAGLMATLMPGLPQDALVKLLQALLTKEQTTLGGWQGTAPSPRAFAQWHQAWSPLMLEWMVDYTPTLASDEQGQLAANWQFDGTHYNWTGDGLDPKKYPTHKKLSLTGRTVVTPYAQVTLADKLRKYLAEPGVANEQLTHLVETVTNWDVLAQSMSGLTDQLLTLRSQETFEPPRASQGDTLSLKELVQDQYHLVPILDGGATPESPEKFLPIRGGAVTFQTNRLWLIDAFSQVYDLTKANSGKGFQPLISPSLRPPASKVFPGITPFVLSPRLVQDARLNLTLLANDSSGLDARRTPANNPVCGWLLPNRLDHSLAVYAADGRLLGELYPLAPANVWRRLAQPDTTLRSATADIPNPTLRRVVATLLALPPAELTDFLRMLDETLWEIDPLGSQAPTSLSMLIGRPLAVVQLAASLELKGPAATNQLWNKMLIPTSTVQNPGLVHDTGGLEDTPKAKGTYFPVRLGSQQLRNDGLVGYFFEQEVATYPRFYSVHPAPIPGGGTGFITPILRGDGSGIHFQGELALQANGPAPTVLTLLLDPRGVVHGYSGILPVQTVAVPGHLVEEFMRKLLVTFQTGPVLADPGPLRLPLPAPKLGTWQWGEYAPVTDDYATKAWAQYPLVEATAEARFPAQPPVLREGWLQLSDIAAPQPDEKNSH